MAGNWNVQNVTAAANDVAAPTEIGGATVASKETETVTNALHTTYSPTTYAFKAGQVYTASVYVLAGTRTFGGIYCDLGTGNTYTLYNLTTGANANGAFASGRATWAVSSITAKDNGWWRITLTFLINTGVAAFVQAILSSNGASISYAGDTSKYIWVVGAQMVPGYFEGDYQVTGATNIVRPIARIALPFRAAAPFHSARP